VSRNFIVYALRHPVTGEVRYVGCTERGAALRLSEHMASAMGGEKYRIHEWIRSLTKSGLGKPWLTILEECGSSEEMLAAEVRHIAHFGGPGTETGGRLTNLTWGGESSPMKTESVALKQGATMLRKYAEGAISRRDVGERRKAWYASLSEGERELEREKLKDGWNAMSEAQRASFGENSSRLRREYWDSNSSPEFRSEHAKKIAAGKARARIRRASEASGPATPSRSAPKGSSKSV